MRQDDGGRMFGLVRRPTLGETLPSLGALV